MSDTTSIHFVRIGTSTDAEAPDLLLHTGSVDIVSDADKDRFDLCGFSGIGQVLAIDEIEVGVDASTNIFSFRLSPLSPEAVCLILSRGSLGGSPVHIIQGMGRMVGGSLQLHARHDIARGWIDSEQISREAITIRCYTPSAQIRTVVRSPTLWTNAQQQSLVDPTDHALFAANRTAQNIELIFPV